MTGLVVRYANERAEGIEKIRSWARREVAKGRDPASVHRDLVMATQAILGEFRTEFEVPGVRYWEHPQTRSFFTTMPGEPMRYPADQCVELRFYEYQARQGLGFGYEDRL